MLAGRLEGVAVVPKTKIARLPAFVPLEQMEARLLEELRLREANGDDVVPLLFHLIGLYLVWSEDGPVESFEKKGEKILKRLLVLHRRGPPIDNAINTAASWYHDRGQFEEALPFYEELLADQRAALGPEHHGGHHLVQHGNRS